MPDAPPTLVIALDGLRAAAIGAYGQTAYETPTLDAFAAEAITHDWCYAPTPDPRDLYQRLAPSLPAGAVVLTDDAAATKPLVAAGADEFQLRELTPEAVADSIAETTAAETLAGVAERMVALFTEGAPPALVWVHLRGLHGPWDAPVALHEPLVDEGDPEVVASLAPPEEEPPDDELNDAMFTASCRYAGQVIVWDACLAALLDLVDGLLEGRELRVVFAGLRGFALGEHGRLGGNDRRLFSERQQVPLLVRDTDPANRFTRLAGPHTLDAALHAVLAGGSLATGSARLESSDANALIDSERMLRVDHRHDEATAELYLKPDDRWEQNNIASLEEETVARMLSELAGDSGVAADGSNL